MCTGRHSHAKAVDGMSRLQKRSRLVDDSDPTLKKRRKVQHRTAKAAAVATDENLHWREVAIPERLEDAEGFLGIGIEETEDVEIFKDKSSGRVTFRVSLSPCS